MFSKPNLIWGAFPGETLDNVESGIGIVKNYMMYDHPEKSVLYTPFISAEHIGAPNSTLNPTIKASLAIVDMVLNGVRRETIQQVKTSDKWLT